MKASPKSQILGIKALMRSKGITQRWIAERLGTTPETVRNVIKGISGNPRIRQSIALNCGVSIQELWPDTALLTAEQVAKILNVPLSTIYYWNSQRKLPFIKLHGKLVRYDRRDIEEFIRKRRIA